MQIWIRPTFSYVEVNLKNGLPLGIGFKWLAPNINIETSLIHFWEKLVFATVA